MSASHQVATLLDKAARLDQAGDKAGAVAAYMDALAIEPDNLVACINAAVCQAERGEWPQSLNLLNAATNLQPDLAVAHRLAGDVLTAMKRHEEAASAYERAAAIEADGETLIKLATALDLADRPDDALAALSQAEAAGANPLETGAYAANVCATRGRTDEAAAHLEAMLARDPANPMAHLMLTTLGRGREGEELSRIISKLRYAGAPPIHLAPLQFALARQLMAGGEFDKAFAAFAAGNRAQASRSRDDLDASRAIFEFCKERFSTPPQSSNDGKDLVFVFGLPRSGTTLVEQIIAAHPQAAGMGELDAFGWIVRYLQNGDDGDRRQAAASAYRAAIPARCAQARRIVDKSLAGYLWLGAIAHLFPAARLIHCRRHPLDAAASMFCQMFEDDQLVFTTSLERIAAHYRLYEQAMDHWRRCYADRLHEVRYEHLVTAPRQQADTIIAHAGLAWDDACLAFHRATATVRTASRAQVRKSVYTSSVGRWRRFEAGLAPLVETIGDIVEAYERSAPGNAP